MSDFRNIANVDAARYRGSDFTEHGTLRK